MKAAANLTLDEIQKEVCRIASYQLGLGLENCRLESRLIEELQLDSLDTIELLMELEDHFSVTLPGDAPHPSYKAVFTRSPFRISDLAELVYLQRNSGPPQRRRAARPPAAPTPITAPFTQLGGRLLSGEVVPEKLLEKTRGAELRRRTDGMRCVRVPAATVAIGEDSEWSCADERPQHTVYLDSFVIDAEPVSTTAYARFLNSIPDVGEATLRDWFVLDPQDRRHEHALLECVDGAWRPRAGTEQLPMMLVSWFGASAYSAWANLRDWRAYGEAGHSLLPSEAQWEYAARGAAPRRFPWGDEPAADRAHAGVHTRGASYSLDSLPLMPTHARCGMSPFELHHMAGNVWQWCRDAYDPEYYRSAAAARPNPVNLDDSGLRAERGGSWVGPLDLGRSSYRRGRAPHARGRCLGFRCLSVSPVGGSPW